MFIYKGIKDNRKSYRVQVSRAIRYECLKEKSSGSGLTYDINENGVRIQIGEFFPQNTLIDLKFQMNDLSVIHHLKAQVRWSEKIPYTDRYHVGLKFTDISPRLKEEIQGFLNSPRF